MLHSDRASVEEDKDDDEPAVWQIQLNLHKRKFLT